MVREKADMARLVCRGDGAKRLPGALWLGDDGNTSADYNIRLQLSKKVATRALTNLNKNIRWCPRELKNTNN